MKKILIFVLLIIVIISTVYYIYADNQAKERQAIKENQQFEFFTNDILYGTELVTVINMIIDSNEKYQIEKDENDKYIPNSTNSIEMDIKFIDDDIILNANSIFNSGIENFISYYSEIKFKCESIEYHEETGKIKYMLFVQITQ